MSTGSETPGEDHRRSRHVPHRLEVVRLYMSDNIYEAGNFSVRDDGSVSRRPARRRGSFCLPLLLLIVVLLGGGHLDRPAAATQYHSYRANQYLRCRRPHIVYRQ